MVMNNALNKIIQRLENYFIQLCDFRLTGETFDLLLLLPVESSYTSKFSLLISSKYLNGRSPKQTIGDLYHDFKASLSAQEYVSISNITVMDSNNALVKHLKTMFPFPENIVELTNMTIGGTEIEKAFILRMPMLALLKKGNIVHIRDDSGGSFSGRLLSMDNNFNLKYKPIHPLSGQAGWNDMTDETLVSDVSASYNERVPSAINFHNIVSMR